MFVFFGSSLATDEIWKKRRLICVELKIQRSKEFFTIVLDRW